MNNKVKILIVDDDVNILLSTSLILKSGGYEIYEAANGNDALAAIREKHPDLVLLDVLLPDINGIEICKNIKSDPELRDIYVVLFSASKKESDAQSEGLEAGADGYITRPIPNRELLARVESFIRNKRKHGALKILLEKRSDLELILNNSPAIIFLWRAEENLPVEFVSENITQFGYTSEELLSGQVPFESIIYPDDLSVIKDKDRELSQSKEGKIEKEYRISAKTGEIHWLHDMTFIRTNSAGEITHYQSIMVDITERKKLEEKRINLSKLETVHNMVVTLNHEMNQPLTIICANAELLMKEVGEESSFYTGLKSIHTQAWEIANLIRKIRRLREIKTTEYSHRTDMIDLHNREDASSDE